MTSRIIVIEGASGSGKTTLVNNLLKRNPTWITPPKLTFPRERNMELEVTGNSASDYLNIVTATGNMNSTVICDRGFLGHWVYQEIKYDWTENWLSRLTQSIQYMLDLAGNEVILRNTETIYIGDPPSIHIIGLVPSTDQLSMQRKSSGREYPYNEAEIYERMLQQLRKPIESINLKTTILFGTFDISYIEEKVIQ